MKTISLKKAGNYLSVNSDKEIKNMVKSIINNPNQNELIDYVEGVQVWEKIEFEFTCKEFIKLISK
jgi:uncharacterized protein YpbB